MFPCPGPWEKKNQPNRFISLSVTYILILIVRFGPKATKFAANKWWRARKSIRVKWKLFNDDDVITDCKCALIALNYFWCYSTELLVDILNLPQVTICSFREDPVALKTVFWSLAIGLRVCASYRAMYTGFTHNPELPGPPRSRFGLLPPPSAPGSRERGCTISWDSSVNHSTCF